MSMKHERVEVTFTVAKLIGLRNLLDGLGKGGNAFAEQMAGQVTTILDGLAFKCEGNCHELHSLEGFADDTLYGDLLCYDCAAQQLIEQAEDLEANKPEGTERSIEDVKARKAVVIQ